MNNQIFKGLADPTRREILRLLSKGEMNAGELADRFDMTKPTVSHHFAVLKEADLIASRREGQQIIYSLNTTVAQDVLTWLWDLFGSESRSAAPSRTLNHELAQDRPAQGPATKSHPSGGT